MPRDSAIGYHIDSFSKGGESQAQLGLVLFHLTKILYDKNHRALPDDDSDGDCETNGEGGRRLRSQVEVTVLQSVASDYEALICDRRITSDTTIDQPPLAKSGNPADEARPGLRRRVGWLGSGKGAWGVICDLATAKGLRLVLNDGAFEQPVVVGCVA